MAAAFRLLSDGLPLRSYLGQADPHHAHADQGAARQVDALGKDAAQHAQGKQRLLIARKGPDKVRPLLFIHARLLHHQGQAGELLRHHAHVEIGGEEHGVFARLSHKHGPDGGSHGGGRRLALLIAGVERHMQAQKMLRREGGGQLKARVLLIAAKKLAHLGQGRQGGRVADKAAELLRRLFQIGRKIKAQQADRLLAAFPPDQQPVLRRLRQLPPQRVIKAQQLPGEASIPRRLRVLAEQAEQLIRQQIQAL